MYEDDYTQATRAFAAVARLLRTALSKLEQGAK